MLILIPLFLTALAAQDSQDSKTQEPTAVITRGGIQAPTQPSDQSSSAYRVTDRFAPPSPAGSHGRIKTPVRSLVAVRGQEANMVTGIGLVTGLAGTGDSGDLAKILLRNMLQTQNMNVDIQALASKNIAVVRVESELFAGIKPGRRVNVRVSTIGDARSLEGGTLTPTELTDMTGQVVYATASGPITVGGFSAEGAGATAKKNHVTVGVMPSGGKVERLVPTQVVSEHGFIYLDSKVGQDTFGNLVKAAEAINGMYPGVATVLPDGKTVRVAVPADLPESTHIAYLDSILKQEVESDNLSRVIINERSGVIVMGGDVRLRPGAVALGGLTVTIAETPQASQPGPLSGGSTEKLDRTNLQVEESDSALIAIPAAVTLQEVVDVLNVLGASPRDMISILSAMSEGGLLVAEIHRM